MTGKDTGTGRPPGYTVPLVDLAEETFRQVEVDREPGQYLGHPSMVLLEDGRTIIVVYPKGHGRGALVMKKSRDGGLTWSERLPTPDNWETSQETPTLYRLVDRRGRPRLVMFSGGWVPVRMAVSEDDGETWSPLRPIGDYGGIVAMSDLVRLADGRHMAFFHGMNRRFAGEEGAGRGGTGKIYRTVSDDGGLTWGEPEPAVSHPEAGICEPGIVRSPDGRRLAMLLRENRRLFNSFISFSDDEGQSWTAPVELPGSLTGDRHQARYAPDGRLFISFRDTTRATLTRGDWVGWVGRFEDLEKGDEGQYRVRFMKNYRSRDCAYPTIAVLPDGTFVNVTYGTWQPGQQSYIMCVRFRLEELDEHPGWVYRAGTAPASADRPAP